MPDSPIEAALAAVAERSAARRKAAIDLERQRIEAWRTTTTDKPETIAQAAVQHFNEQEAHRA